MKLMLNVTFALMLAGVLLTGGLAVAQAPPTQGCDGFCGQGGCGDCHNVGEWDYQEQVCYGCALNASYKSTMPIKVLASARKQYSPSLNNRGLEVAVLSSVFDFLRGSSKLNVHKIPGHVSKEYVAYMQTHRSFAFCADALRKQIIGINERLAREYSRSGS